jgi:hypothetical protein
MPSWLLRAMITTASSWPGFSSRCGTKGGTKFPAAYVDERLVPAVFGHHASNYLLNRAIISDTLAR